jgi:hypothetical protein
VLGVQLWHLIHHCTSFAKHYDGMDHLALVDFGTTSKMHMPGVHEDLQDYFCYY